MLLDALLCDRNKILALKSAKSGCTEKDEITAKTRSRCNGHLSSLAFIGIGSIAIFIRRIGNSH